jgi:glycine cleavage system H lipoate-binding protein
MLELGAKSAVLLRDGKEVQVPIEAVVVGDLMLVRPGEKVPSDGEVVEGNAALASAPETVNADPEGEGWFAKIKVSDTSTDGLMDRAAYDQYLSTL